MKTGVLVQNCTAVEMARKMLSLDSCSSANTTSNPQGSAYCKQNLYISTKESS